MSISYNGFEERVTLRDRIGALLGRKEAPFAPSMSADMNLPSARWSTRNARTFVEDGYKLNSAVFACTRALATGFAEAPLYCYLDETRKKILPKHPLRQLFKRPNPLMGEDEFWKFVITYAATTGNAYGQGVPSKGGRWAEIWPYSDIVMQPVPGGPRWVDKYRYSLDNGLTGVDVPFEEVTHFKWAIDPESPFKGVGALNSVSREVDTDNELTRYLKALLQNDAVTRGIIHVPEGTLLTPKQKQELKHEWKLRFGRDNRGDVGVLEKGMTYERVALNLQELAFDSLRGVPEARISAAYGVPAIVAGLNIGLARSTYSNYEEARKAFAEQTLAPLWKSVASIIQNDLVPLFGNDCYVDFDLTQVRALQTSSDRKDQFTVLAYTGGILTLDQALVRMGEEPVGGTEGAVRALPTPTPTATQAPAMDLLPTPAPGAEDGNGGLKQLTGGAIERKAGGSTVEDAREKLTAGLEKKVQSYLQDEYGAIADHLEGDDA